MLPVCAKKKKKEGKKKKANQRTEQDWHQRKIVKPAVASVSAIRIITTQ